MSNINKADTELTATVSDRQFSKLFDSFWRSTMTVRMLRNEYIKQRLRQLMTKQLDDAKRYDELLSETNKQISKIFKKRIIVAITEFGLLFLLYCSLINIRFEIPYVGLSLSDTEKLKEFIVIGVFVGYVFAIMSSEKLEYLQCFRELLIEKIYGAISSKVIINVLYAPMEDVFSWDEKRYIEVGRSQIVLIVKWFVLFLGFMGALLLFSYLYLYVIIDIYAHSNFNIYVGKAIALATSIIWVLTVSQAVLSSDIWGKVHYYDRVKTEKFLKKSKKQRKKEILEYINKETERQKQ